jgi:glycosyltransferase involved in cell wall biosynthesis
VTKLKFLMTTTFYPPYHVGGACLHVKWLAEELARRGHEVHVMFSLDAYQIKRGRVQGLATDEDAVHLHPLRSPRGRLEPLLVYLQGRSTYFSKQFETLLERISPDVVHHHNLSLLGYDLLRKRGSYLNLYTAHDHWFICQLNGLFRNSHPCMGNHSCPLCALRSRRPPQVWRRKTAFIRAIRDIDLAIAPSHYLSDTLSGRTGLSFVTIPNFVPHPPEHIPPSGFSDYFLFVGTLESHKGIAELVELFRNHRDEIGAHLLVAGTGSLARKLQTYVRENALEDVVRLLGFCNHSTLYPLYHDALALVVPSLCPENSPLVALEALSVGTPVVASNVGGLPEVAAIQGEGFSCDPVHLKEALIRARNARPNRQQTRDIYQRRFSPEGYLPHYLELLAGTR